MFQQILQGSIANTLGFQGEWKELFIEPTEGFSAMIYGLPKSGKSTFSLHFANYLARNFGTVLYAGIEEVGTGTFDEKLERLNLRHPDLVVKNHLPMDLSGFDFVFMEIGVESLQDLTT